MTSTPAERTLQFTRGDARPQRFGNVVAVEFRKLFSTGSLRTLAIVSLALALLIVAATTVWHEQLFAPQEEGAPWAPWFEVAVLLRMPLQMLLGAFVALFMTSEWTTRSVMTTFTLTPKRGRVIAAKAVVVFVIGLVTWALTAGGAIFATHVGRSMVDVPTDGMWLTATQTLGDAAQWILTMFIAFGIALLTQNGALAIAIIIAAPMAVTIMRQISETLRDALGWVDFQQNSLAFLVGGDMSLVGQFIVATCVWCVIPLALGAWRTMKREAA